MGQRVIRRLRSYRIVAPDVPVRLQRLSRGGSRQQHGWSWRAVHAVTGHPLGVGSLVTMEACANAGRWEIEKDPNGFILVKPVSSEPAEAKHEGVHSQGERVRERSTVSG